MGVICPRLTVTDGPFRSAQGDELDELLASLPVPSVTVIHVLLGIETVSQSCPCYQQGHVSELEHKTGLLSARGFTPEENFLAS